MILIVLNQINDAEIFCITPKVATSKPESFNCSLLKNDNYFNCLL